MPNNSVQIASHLAGASFSRDLSTGIVNLSHNLSRARNFQLSEKAFLKRRQEQAEAAMAKAEAERLKMEKEINEQVAARMKKEKVENRFNPDISLASA